MSEILGCLSYLPVAILERGVDRRLHRGAVERRQGQHGAPADRGLVVTGHEDGVESGRITQRAERGDGRLTGERVVVRRRRRGERCGRPGRHGHGAELAQGPGRGLHHGAVGVAEQLDQPGDELRRLGSSGEDGCELSHAPTDDDIGVGQRVRPRLACGGRGSRTRQRRERSRARTRASVSRSATTATASTAPGAASSSSPSATILAARSIGPRGAPPARSDRRRLHAVTPTMGGARIGVRARVAFGCLLIAASAASAFLALGPRDDALDRPHPLATAAIAHAALMRHNGTWTLPLPRPSPPPDDPYAAVELNQMGSIQIPALGLTQPVFDGIWLTVLDVGLGHWPGTAAFGGEGNVVIAGHRVTHGAPFRDLDRLGPGDSILLQSATATYTYRIISTGVVDSDALWIADQHPGHTLTLFACHPPGSARYRYVVTAELVA